MKKMIYDNAFTRFTDKEFDEKYALISHAIQLGDTTNAKKYRDILKKKGIDASDLPSAELFNRENKIEVSHQMRRNMKIRRQLKNMRKSLQNYKDN